MIITRRRWRRYKMKTGAAWLSLYRIRTRRVAGGGGGTGGKRASPPGICIVDHARFSDPSVPTKHVAPPISERHNASPRTRNNIIITRTSHLLATSNCRHQPPPPRGGETHTPSPSCSRAPRFDDVPTVPSEPNATVRSANQSSSVV